MGHKQLDDDPWDAYELSYTVGSDFDGMVKEVFGKGSIVLIDDKIEAFCPIKHSKKEDGSQLDNGETASFRVLEFSKDNRRILVSHRQTFEEEL